MEPNDPNKNFNDLFKNISFSFTVPAGFFDFNKKIETAEEMIERLDDIDKTVDAMNEYPQAKKMLDGLYGEK
jgi:hypothetical protein